MQVQTINKRDIRQMDRLYFIDNLRTFLTVLVIIHHLAITYGAGGSWYYVEGRSGIISKTILSIITQLNQGYFMGLFFFISGYFVPLAIEKKGYKLFLRDRFIRLGIPLLVFGFFISPFIEYFKAVRLGYYHGTVLNYFFGKTIYIKSFNDFCPDPLWFVETLLAFSIFYVLIRGIIRKTNTLRSNKPINSWLIIKFIIFLSVFFFITKIFFPFGQETFHLQLGFYPQYISYFAVGIATYNNNWIDGLTDKLGKRWLLITIITVLLLPVNFIIFTSDELMNGLRWQAIVSAVSVSLYGTAMSISIIYIFRKKFNNQGMLFKVMTPASYTTYIIHAPIIVFIAYSLRDLMLQPILKFLVVTSISICICYIISYIIIKLPYARKVL